MNGRCSLDGLESKAARPYAALKKLYPEEGVIPLTLRYVDELKQMTNSNRY